MTENKKKADLENNNINCREILDESSDDMSDDMMEEEIVEDTSSVPMQVYLPGNAIGNDEVLDFDSSAYVMYHSMNVEWPCLSFDVIKDAYGDERVAFPMKMSLVTGTQASDPDKNSIIIMKIKNLSKLNNNEDSDGNESSDEERSNDEPVLEYSSIVHHGGINRIRMMPHKDVQIAATWADTGKVHIWNLTDLYKNTCRTQQQIPPSYSNVCHTTEGFALDWSPLVSGNLLTGDCEKNIFLTTKSSSSWETESLPFRGHQDSVEDLQWSPVENSVFASCSVDQTIKIWDTRVKNRKFSLSLHAHTSDINVISWNRNVSYLIASGADDGSFSVWDLRNFKESAAAASFNWHKGSVTSIEWHSTDHSVLAVSGADNQISLWDFSVEQDMEEDDQNVPDVPASLMFIHQGQNDIKELHWHPQIPSVLISTAESGFNIFKTISV